MKQISDNFIKKIKRTLITMNVVSLGLLVGLVVYSQKQSNKKSELLKNMYEAEDLFKKNPTEENKKKLDQERRVFFYFVGARDSL